MEVRRFIRSKATTEMNLFPSLLTSSGIYFTPLPPIGAGSLGCTTSRAVPLRLPHGVPAELARVELENRLRVVVVGFSVIVHEH